MKDSPWLLVDETGSRRGWGLSGDSIGFIATSSEVKILSNTATLDLKNPKLLLLLLTPAQEFRFDRLPGLAEAFLSEPEWTAWCHFGGDISMAGHNNYSARWETWLAMNKESKELLKKANANSPPLPFSRLQELPWSPEFRKVKRVVSFALRNKQGSFDHADWRRIGKHLRIAQAKTLRQASTAALNQALNQTLAAMFQIRAIVAAISSLDRPPYELAASLVGVDGTSGLFHSYGFDEHSIALELAFGVDGFPTLKRHYDAILASTRTLGQLMRKSVDGGAKDDSEQAALAAALPAALADLKQLADAFCGCYGALSVKATELLQDGRFEQSSLSPGV